MTLTPEARKLFARIVILSQQIKEESWVPRASRLGGGHYKINDYQSVEMACDRLQVSREWVTPIYLCNLLAWNDIQEWAERQIR